MSEKKSKKSIRVSKLPTVSLQNLRKSRRSMQTQHNQQQNHLKQSALFIDVQIENNDNIVQQFAHTVRRVRKKPMGRYKHWSIDNVNTQCELVHNIRIVEQESVVRTPFNELLSNSKMLVLDMIGQHVGKLYTPVGKQSTDVLYEDSCIADVFDITYHKPTHSFRMRVVPFKPSQTSESQLTTSHLTKKNVFGKDANIVWFVDAFVYGKWNNYPRKSSVQ